MVSVCLYVKKLNEAVVLTTLLELVLMCIYLHICLT